MDLGLAGKVAIVTGGSRGVGRAIAAALLREGARVVISARDPERLEATRAALAQETGGEVRAKTADLGRDADAKALIDATRATFGHLDILVNNAATVMPADFLTLTEERWAEVFEQKVNGYVRCLRHAIPAMKGKGWGRIINLSGLAGREPGNSMVPVGVNNAAVLNLTKALARDLAPEHILVNAVVPTSSTRTSRRKPCAASRPWLASRRWRSGQSGLPRSPYAGWGARTKSPPW